MIPTSQHTHITSQPKLGFINNSQEKEEYEDYDDPRLLDQ
jgi:hypothetical protein